MIGMRCDSPSMRALITLMGPIHRVDTADIVETEDDQSADSGSEADTCSWPVGSNAVRLIILSNFNFIDLIVTGFSVEPVVTATVSM